MRKLKDMIAEHDKKPKLPMLKFKEFCRYVYEPPKIVKEVVITDKERHGYNETIECCKL